MINRVFESFLECYAVLHKAVYTQNYAWEKVILMQTSLNFWFCKAYLTYRDWKRDSRYIYLLTNYDPADGANIQSDVSLQKLFAQNLISGVQNTHFLLI